MPISEALVAQVVAQTSEQMKDPSYVQLAVGSFVQAQPDISHFLSSKAARLGGAQSLVQLVFHAEVLCECLRHGRAAPLPTITFAALDRASQGDFVARFSELEPQLASYVASNLDEPALRTELSRVGLALCLSLEG